MLAIVFGLIASILVVAMSLTVKRRNVVRITVVLSLTTTIQYALLEQWGVVWLAAIGTLYATGLMLSHRVSFLGGKKAAWVLVALYTTGFIAINGVSLSWGLFSYAASILGALMLLIVDPLKLKYAMLVNGVLWVVFQVAAGAYGQLPGEALYVVGVVYSIVALSVAKNRGVNLSTVPELTTVIKGKLSRRTVEAFPST